MNVMVSKIYVVILYSTGNPPTSELANIKESPNYNCLLSWGIIWH